MMKTKPKMNIRLLRRIQKQIAKEPRQFGMRGWFLSNVAAGPIPNCGTAACIGGWAACLSKNRTPREAHDKLHCLDMVEVAGKLPKLTRDQAERLFSKSRWPEQFWFHFESEGTKLAANKAIARIDHYIKTKGAE